MVIDEGFVEILCEDLIYMVNIFEKCMFGGFCFMFKGNMFCGVYKNGGMFRVGKKLEVEVFVIEGVWFMEFIGCFMVGFVDVDDDLLGDDDCCFRMFVLVQVYVGVMFVKQSWIVKL